MVILSLSFIGFQPDDAINFMQLRAKAEAGSLEDQFELSLSAAVGTLAQKKEAKDLSSTKLNKVKRHYDIFFFSITFPGIDFFLS